MFGVNDQNRTRYMEFSLLLVMSPLSAATIPAARSLAVPRPSSSLSICEVVGPRWGSLAETLGAGKVRRFSFTTPNAGQILYLTLEFFHFVFLKIGFKF